MSPHHRMHLPNKSIKLIRLMERAERKMALYWNEMNSPDGQAAWVYLSGIAAIVAIGGRAVNTSKKQ